MAAFKSNRLTPPLMWAFRYDYLDAEDRQASEPKGIQAGERLVPGRKNSTWIAEKVLRNQVKRDLHSLLNAVSMESTAEEVKELPNVRTSVLNYGLPDIAHRSIDELSRNDNAIEKEIEAALRTYEPRLIAGSLRVRRDSSLDITGLKVRYIVVADLSCRPVDIPLEFTAEVEIDSGKVVIGRL